LAPDQITNYLIFIVFAISEKCSAEMRVIMASSEKEGENYLDTLLNTVAPDWEEK